MLKIAIDDGRFNRQCSLAAVGVLDCPDCCLRAISDVYLPQDCFQMNFDCRFR